ncbi:hypothetical protein BJ741DRAFT_235786 [Chytriomyces cf. hyalinus JEL632]|nr:hypothetical protein BJ741DRAFT_235786 [Chytriomyces cf. hyalinus JEL632]
MSSTDNVPKSNSVSALESSMASLMSATQPASAPKTPQNGLALPVNHSLQTAPSTSSHLSLSSTPAPVCHGKVTDLASMVPTQWWEQVFCDSMYLKTDGDVVEDPDVTRQEVAIFERNPDIKRVFMKGADGKSTPSKILDLCCGQGRHTLHIASTYPHISIHGHDQSAYLISVGKERAAASNLSKTAQFTIGDCRQIPHPSETFDLVLLLGNSFGYFKAEDGDRMLLAEIWRVLSPSGVLVVDLTDGQYMRDNFAERSWEWVDDTTFVCRERQLSPDKLRLISREVITISNRGVVRDQFYQERLYTREELIALLVEGGFDVESNEQCVLDDATRLSKRQQDLGMMGHRMIITASKKDSNAPDMLLQAQEAFDSLPVNHPKPEMAFQSIPILDATFGSAAAADKKAPLASFESLVLVLGDPSQPCVGKLNDTWNAEDFITREKLITALTDLGYTKETNLRVFDTHNNLHESLKRLSSKKEHFVFNLCDEGYDNNALQELHVPAILEMLRVPYSGAGPNCLAFCYDKGLVNRTADALGVPTPKEIPFLSDVATPAVSNLTNLHKVIEEKVHYPAFIKPIKGDNSLGITARSIVHNQQELNAYMSELGGMGIRDVVVQEYCQGTEYGVGMIGNLASGFHFFPVLEVDYSKIVARNLAPILGFESKWDPTSPWWTDISYKPARISDRVKAELQSWCIVLWERFGCRDYARFDFRCDYGRGDGFEAEGERRGTIKLLEVNPNPGWCWDGKFAYMGSFENKDYKDVLGMILKAAHDRITHEKRIANSSKAAK